MEAQKNYIVFQCYGYERVFHECAYALLSLCRLYGPQGPADTEVWIYTDKPEWFKKFKGLSLPLQYRQVDTEIINKWKGDIDFVHRVKIELLKDFVSGRKGNVLYVDTDVVFTYNMDKLFAGLNEGRLYMHVMESIVSEGRNPLLKKLAKYLQDNNKTYNDTPLAAMAMWNAGVLGFNTSHGALLDKVLDFTDKEYKVFPKHIMEQFAFSVFFQQQGDVKAATPYILHYWNMKEAGEVLASFFTYFNDSDWQELTKLAALIQVPDLMQEKVNFMHNRSLTDNVARKKWQPQIPHWERLSKQI